MAGGVVGGAATLGCASTPPVADDVLETKDPVLQHELSVSHLKESEVALTRQTVESAEQAIHLTTRGLKFAPPNGHAKSWAVSHLLLTRGRASAQLAKLDAAVADFEAALIWAGREPGPSPLLTIEIQLANAEALARQGKHEVALRWAGQARAGAQVKGKEALVIHLTALLLEGDLALRLAKTGAQAPSNYYRGLFQVAKKFDYPEECWSYLDSALLRLAPISESERRSLMGPVPGLRLRAAEEEKPAYVRAKERRGPAQSFQMSEGTVENADEVVARLRPAFRRCHETGLQLEGATAASIRVNFQIGPDGGVTSVTESHSGLHGEVVECVLLQARRARFSPPKSGSASLSVPVTFVSQR